MTYSVQQVVCLCLSALLLALAATQLPAQTPTPSFASPYLPAHHWAVEAARRLSTLGLTDRRFGWGDGSLTRREVGLALESAVANAPLAHPELAPIAQGYWARFAQEFPVTTAMLAGRTVPISARVEGRAAIGYASETGRVLPVRSLDRTRENISGPAPLSDWSGVAVNAAFAAPIGRYLAGSIAPMRQDGDWSLGDSYLLAAWKSVGIWGGQRSFAFGPGASGGIVFNGNNTFTGGGIALVQPIRLPWVFRYLGPIRFETFLSRIDSSAAVKDPWVIASHASLSPHPRLLISATQAFMFSGSGLAPFNWPNFKAMFRSHGINSAGSEYENGIASVDVRFSAPTPVVPTVLYLEWGSEDNHRAWKRFPGIVAGLEVPAIPGLPALSLGVERAFFHEPCTGCEYYATWYRHYVFKDGWTVDRQLIGHPLGGDGSEWLVYGHWDDPAHRLRLDARAYLRDRGRFNLFSPAREGRSTGGRLALTYRSTSNLDVVLDTELEVGERDWTASRVFGGFRWLF